MSNYAVETDVTSGNIVGVGRRVDFYLTADDAINGFFIEVENSATLAGTVTVDMYHSLDKESATVLASAAVGNTYYDINIGGAATQHLGTLTFDFSSYTRNQVFIKPGVTIGAVTLPDQLLPVFTLRFRSEDLKFKGINATKRGIK